MLPPTAASLRPRSAIGPTVVHIGPAPAAQSYLDGDKIIAAAKSVGAQAIHPGYGFLSENAKFAQACVGAGIKFIGPNAASMEMMGSKTRARQEMEKAGVPFVPGTSRALESARNLLRRDPKSKDHKRFIVLITDGEDLEGSPVGIARSIANDGTMP